MAGRILVTGAAGMISSFFVEMFAGQYDVVLTDIREPAETHGYPFVPADLANLDQIRAACRGIHTVVHMGADRSTQAEWESLLPRNVVGVYNVFEAAREAGCRRVVYASSINAVNGYGPDVQVRTSMVQRPMNLYGATKVWAEAAAHAYAHTYGMSMIGLRFGGVVRRDHERISPSNGYLSAMITLDDAARLIRSAIEAPEQVRYGVYHGVSNNRWKRLDISDAREEIGYDPQDDMFVLAGMLRPSTG